MVSEPKPVTPQLAAQSELGTGLPTLLGEGYGSYQTSKRAFAFSYLGNCAFILLLVCSSRWVIEHRDQIKQQITGTVTGLVLPPGPTPAGGGGGGGDRDKLNATHGAPPKFANEQLAPPTVVVRNEHPLLPVDPTVLGPPQIQLAAQNSQMGDPLSAVVDSLSNGKGSGGGIGNGEGTGVGTGKGPGVGPGHGGSTGGNAYRPGLGGVTAPRPIYAPDPQYSDEARSVKFQGSVVLWLIVGADGLPKDIRIVRSVGLGLDELALETVKTWRFDPGHKDGQPVATQINVEVSFRLY
jgi:periplasmic protein TonB